jgi:ABC-type Zn2+ transport system substrate-binding protein/surface adhesin
MSKLKNHLLWLIHKNAARTAADLAGQYARAEPQEKEAILAGLEFERWLAECCQKCLT